MTADIRSRLELAIAEVLASEGARENMGDGEWRLEHWVLVASHRDFDSETTCTSYHTSSMPDWMARGLLDEGLGMSREDND